MTTVNRCECSECVYNDEGECRSFWGVEIDELGNCIYNSERVNNENKR